MQTVTPTKQRVNRFAVRCALYHLKQLRRAQAAYDEEVDAWYRSGEGRSPKWHTFVEGDDVWRANVGGKGYRFPVCPHGMSLWTDYDNICGPCEDGLTLQQQALYAGHDTASRYLDRMSVVQYAHDQGAPEELVRGLTEWAIESLPAEMNERRIVRHLP